MPNVNFENILYLSPQVKVYPDYAIIKTEDLSDLDRILEMCGVERDLEEGSKVIDGCIYIKLKNKE